MAVQTKTFSINQSQLPLNQGDILTFKLVLKSSSSVDFTAFLSNSDILEISSLAASTGYSTVAASSYGPNLYFSTSSLSSSFTSSINNVITFDVGLSSFHNRGYIFAPNPLSGSQNSLYPTYGDVDYGFDINPQDIVLAYLSDNTYVENRVLGVFTTGSASGSLVQIKLDGDMNALYKSNIASKGPGLKRFLVLKRVEDETNANLTFAKRDGKTSYGFVIPDNLSPDVLANIDTITKEVKQKLLADQQGITTTQ